MDYFSVVVEQRIFLYIIEEKVFIKEKMVFTNLYFETRRELGDVKHNEEEESVFKDFMVKNCRILRNRISVWHEKLRHY